MDTNTAESDSEKDQLIQELNSMRQLAMNVMTSNGDMGVVVQFLKSSFSIPSYNELGTALLESLTSLGLEGAVAIQTYTGRVFVGPNGQLDTELAKRIQDNLLAGRIVEELGEMQINNDLTSLHVSQLPDNDERVGQLRDSLALLMDGAEARVKSLIMEEQTIEARQSKDEFFALMSTELRTPLNPIISYAAKLEKKMGDADDEQYRSVIRAIKDNGESLLRLIDHIIGLGKVEAGEIIVHRREFNVFDAISYSLIKSEDFISQNNINVIKHVDPNLTFVADPPRFIDIVISLLSYAAQASEKHTITINAGVQSDGNSETLVLELKDDAAPIAGVYDTHVFDADADKHTDEMCEQNDLGIGLYLTKKLVELHGGTISLEHDQGNTFTVRLPQDGPSHEIH